MGVGGKERKREAEEMVRLLNHRTVILLQILLLLSYRPVLLLLLSAIQYFHSNYQNITELLFLIKEMRRPLKRATFLMTDEVTGPQDLRRA